MRSLRLSGICPEPTRYRYAGSASNWSWTRGLVWIMISQWRREAHMDVRSRLRSLGLERFERVFRENEIDAEVLPDRGRSRKT